MTQISWNKDYCLGDTVIDGHHQYLFFLANTLLASRNKAELTGNAMRLFRYVREHIDHEEAVMRKIAYPAYREHVALHEDLTDQLSAICSDIGKDQWSDAKLQQFMTRWLTVHIVEEDKKIGRYIPK